MSTPRPVLVVDFGAQYAQLIARRVREAGAPQVDAGLFDADVPVFGICYGFQAMARALGGSVAHTGRREFGGTVLTRRGDGGALLGDTPAEQTVWMSHGDS